MRGSLGQLLFFIVLIWSTSCIKETKDILVTADQYHHVVDEITTIIVHDIFSPPLASRIYAYCNIAAYEVMCQKKPEYNTLAGQIKNLSPIPEPAFELKEDVNYHCAALVAYLEVSRELVFSENKVVSYRDSLYSEWEKLNFASFIAAKKYGLQVAKHIHSWVASDNYSETRSLPKYSFDAGDISHWRPTPPDYMNGIEPHWNKIRPLVIDSASQFKPDNHPEFSLEKGTRFYHELVEVYEVVNQLRLGNDNSEKVEIAKFWDCNPYVSTHKGHLMFATKKITPGAHWMGICKIACKKENADFNKTVYAYTKTSIAIYDAFISCWDEKYRSNLVRPETLINIKIDENWAPILQTPPFPEYTSGHSVISGAAAVCLTYIFGDQFAFDDDTEVPYGLPIRSFPSFENAAEEAAISRLYGGIHYRSAIDLGLKQGRLVGKLIANRLHMTTMDQ